MFFLVLAWLRAKRICVRRRKDSVSMLSSTWSAESTRWVPRPKECCDCWLFPGEWDSEDSIPFPGKARWRKTAKGTGELVSGVSR